MWQFSQFSKTDHNHLYIQSYAHALLLAMICQFESLMQLAKADNNLFKSLRSILDLEVQNFTVTRIGKKSEGKSRLLLVRLSDLATKWQI